MLKEVAPELEPIDNYALAGRYRYMEADPAEALRANHSARSRTREIISNLSEIQLNRTGFLRAPVRGITHYQRSHDQQHLAGMQWLLGQIDSQSTK